MSVLGTTLPQLDVFFEGGVYDQWVNPSNYVCRSFNCPNLPRAIFVGWWNLPLHKVAAFYETPDCTYRQGYYTINTGSTRTQPNGMQHVLSNSRRIRSMMLGRNEADLLQEKFKATSVQHICKLFSFDSATLDANATRPNSTYEIQWKNDENSTGGLSSNWSDVLPDTPDTSLDSSYDDDDAGINNP